MNDPKIIIQLVSAGVALLAAFASIYFSIRTRRDASTQRRIQILSLRRQYDSDLRKWADEVSEVMTEAVFLCKLDPAKLAANEFFTRRHNIRIRLSALADRGRWFLPNVNPDEHGQHKPVAFRGFRQPSLDSVIGAFRLVGGLSYQEQAPNLECMSELVRIKKSFVSELQSILDPNEKEKETTKLIESLDT
jgi:hypothetical protein